MIKTSIDWGKPLESTDGHPARLLYTVTNPCTLRNRLVIVTISASPRADEIGIEEFLWEVDEFGRHPCGVHIVNSSELANGLSPQ